jgi:hypothetical protein
MKKKKKKKKMMITIIIIMNISVGILREKIVFFSRYLKVLTLIS